MAASEPNPPRRLPFVNLFVALVGAVLLAYTVRRVGWSDVASGIASVGWYFVVVVALGSLRMAFRARAWMACTGVAGDTALSFGTAMRAMLAADALGNLTPLGLLASEPAKVMLARRQVTTVAAVASVTIENAIYTASVVVVLLTGTWFFVQRADVPAALEWAAEAVVAGALIAGVVGLWVARARPALLSRFDPWLAKLVGKSAASADALKAIESRIYDVLRWPIGRLARVSVWEAAFHIGAVLEVWLVLRLLPASGHATLVDAFLMESAGRFVTVAFKFIPFRLGVDEAGSGAVAQVLGFGPVTGVTLALVRRIRILVLNAAGLVLLARRRS